MRKGIFKTVLSLVLVLCMAFPSSLMSVAADSTLESTTVVYDYEEVAVKNPVANTWTEPIDNDGPATWAFDNNSTSHWHTNWKTATTENPSSGSFTWGTVTEVPSFADVTSSRVWIGGEFEKAINFGKLEYSGRCDKNDNWMGQYALYIANVADGTAVKDTDFTCVANGTNSGYSKVTIQLETPVTATHFRLVAFTSTSTNHVTGSEIDVFEAIPPVPVFGGAIVDTDTQWTQDRFREVKKLTTDSAELTAWKNDKATSEIALFAANAAYDNVTVTAGDLSDGNGNTISSDNVTASFIKSTKAYNGGYLGYGSPDRVIPADDGTNRSESSDIIWGSDPVDMVANSVQPVWVEFAVPKDAVAGTYTGTVSVTAEGITEPLVFTYTVEVLDATLPDSTDYTFDIMQWQYPYSSAEYYGVEPFSDEHFEILESNMSIYKEVGGNAITTTFTEEAWAGQTYSANSIHYPSMVKWTQNADGSFNYDYTDFDAWVTFCKGMGLGDKIVAYGIAPWHFSFTYWTEGASTYTKEAYTVGNARYVQVWTDFLTDFAAHLEEKGWKENVYIGIDERSVNATAFDIADAAGLKTAADIDNINNHWAIAQRVTDLNVGDTAAYHLKTQFAELKKIRDAKGYKTTLYSCTEHQPGNFSLSSPVESYWTVLNAGMMDADGFNRWAYDAWVADPLRDATHNSFEPGDCFVIFPDEKNAENPTSRYSVRLARMAEGIRDVNKLELMEAEIPALASDVDAVYANIDHALSTGRSYLGQDAVADLAAEADAFKDDLNELTEKYIALKAGGTYEVESVTIEEGDALSIDLGETATLHATLTPDNLINTNVVWSSSNPYVVSVNEAGKIEGLQPGAARITATSEEDDTKSDSITITVNAVLVDESKQVAYYSFDNVEGTALVDEWGSHNGTISASATTAEGKSGNALSVNTAGEGAVVTDYADLDAADWTVAYWVKATTNFDKEISVLEDSTQTYSASLKMADGRASGFRVGNNSGDVITYEYNFAKDTWYYVTWVMDADTGLSMYVDGTLVRKDGWFVGKSTKAPVEVIGGTGFTGLIDEVKVFNAALSQQEIAALKLVQGVNVSESLVEVMVEDTYQLNAYVISDNADKTLTYESTDENIATVDENGLITGVGRGTTTIIIKNEAGGYEARVKVKVEVEISIINKIPRYVLPEEYQSDVEGPYRESGHARRYIGQPDMVQTETGRLITVFPTGHGHGPLIMKISEDQGETWTEKTDIPASWAASQETPTIYSLQIEDETEEDGYRERIVLICACPNWDLKIGGWQMSYSDDNGDTWTEFETFWSEVDGNKNYTIVAMASLVQLKDENGNFKQEWMGVYHNDAFVNSKSILTFDEAGNPQWTKPEAYLSAYRGTESAHQICEVGMFRSPDGERIVALARTQRHNAPSTMFYSDDEGKTWSEPVELPGSLAGERHKALYDPISGKLLITFREMIYDRDSDGVWEGGDDWICGEWVAWVGTYDDIMNLRQGEYKIILDEDFSGNYYSGDTGYTGMAVLEDGTFVLHSYGHWDPASASVSDVRTDLCWIRQAKFKLAELDFEEGGGEEEEVPELSMDAVVKVTAGNEELTYGNASEGAVGLAYDNNTNTKWHTDWYPSEGNTHENHWIQLELNEVYGVAGFKYLPRQDSSSNGTVTGYEIQLSMDGTDWETVAEGTWGTDKAWKEVTFDAQNAKYVRFQVVSAESNQANKKFASAAEVRVLGGETIEEPKKEVCEIFTDVEHGAWYEASVQYVYDEDIIFGHGDKFAPNDATTRAMIAVILYRLAGSPEVESYEKYNQFTDLPAVGDDNGWYTDAVAWALNEDVSTGDTYNKLYNPTAEVTREQLALFLYRYTKYTGVDATVTEDEEKLFGNTYVSPWAREGFGWAIENGIIKGAKETNSAGEVYYALNPRGTATRAQVARMFHRYLGGAVD